MGNSHLFQLSVTSYQLSVIRYQLSVISDHSPSPISPATRTKWSPISLLPVS
ncbi:MAG: hypothetical protein IM525_13445 [Microcystis sp. M43BS1]|uniref:hypothetical protein n=1 Tax=Microcystis sp. M43BS1 TaxID=2771193 RepID=UPI0025871190|nr:hypothetical protein [Microcystis sp. M43BS1]MCA2557726.1 hypothetical protein [Microcystis sp. M43BS1]